VSDVPIVGKDQEGERLLLGSDLPAYVRRALAVEHALEAVVARCRKKRDDWLLVTRIRLGQLHGWSGGWANLRPGLADEGQVRVLEELHRTLAPKLRAPAEPTTSGWVLGGALREVIAGVERFNRRWRDYLPTVDVRQVNALREGYNRYFVMEKECAVRNPAVARKGFVKLPPLGVDELLGLLPLLPVPRPGGAD
jgi:hypothetical protein